MITCTSSSSTDAAGSASDSIALELKDECWDADLTAPTFDETTWTWELWAQQTMPFNAMSDNSHPDDTCGSYSYTVQGEYSSIASISGLTVVAQPSNDDLSQVKTYTFKVRGKLGKYHTIDS